VAGDRGEPSGIHADRAAALGQPPLPQAWAQEVNAVIGDEVPALLARWPIEPPAIRLVLAALAALFPHHGRAVAAHITTMADEYNRTQPGALLHLAVALIDADDTRAVELARDIVAWDEEIDPAIIDAVGIPPALRAGCVLAELTLNIALRTDRSSSVSDTSAS